MIAIDMDDVLCTYTNSLIEWHNREHKTSFTLSDAKEFNLSLFGWDRTTLLQQIDLFAGTDEYKELRIVFGVVDGLTKLLPFFTFTIVTARSATTADATHYW